VLGGKDQVTTTEDPLSSGEIDPPTTRSSPPSASSAPSPSPTSMPSPSPTTTESSEPTASPTSSFEPTQAPTRFASILSLQSVVGECSGDFNGVGCADTDGSGSRGNPNDIVNCYDVTEFGGSAPFSFESVSFWIGDSVPLPSDLSIRLWTGSVDGGPTDEILLTQEISGYGIGGNTFALVSSLVIVSNEVCVGLVSTTITDGLRVQTEMGPGDRSFVLAPNCGAEEFTSLVGFGISANFCIEASVVGF
jgi:hypothetical protein